MGLTILGLLVTIVIVATLFINLSPQFGGKQNKNKLARFELSKNYKEGVFINNTPTSMDMSPAKIWSILKDQFSAVDTKPGLDIDTYKIDSLEITKNKVARITWFGHSAFLLEMNGKNILIDPMLGNVPAPHPWLGANRFSNQLPIEIEKLPRIDVIIFSHDHYDHLDYGSIKLLKDKTDYFLVPLGVGSHLESWDVSADKIKEHDWWEQTKIGGDLNFVFTPSRHFSGRGLGDNSKTLWGSWVIKGENNIFFSGDGGYGPHFKEIGEKYGPFDFAMIECGQYDARWADIHMMPEESAQAGIDVLANVAMPIHWGAFKLAFHPWDEPVERMKAKALELDLPMITPKIGEQVSLDSLVAKEDIWWKNY
ncbi:MAG: MBL fold metallo-hydrolase [Reichenbachiella sp.]